MKQIPKEKIFQTSPDNVFINASYRRKILSPWVILFENMKEPEILVNVYYDLLQDPEEDFNNCDLTWWHNHIHEKKLKK